MSLILTNDNSSIELKEDPTTISDLRTTISDLRELSKIKFEDTPNLLIFPDSFRSYDKDFKKKKICSLSQEGDSKTHLKTNNLVGFIGRNKTHLSIHSRFIKNGENDFFLHFMLQRVAKVNIVNLKHSFSLDGVFDFMVYLFPEFLKKAIRQGIYKQYVTLEHNDANVRGVIDINRHIKNNIPFNGRIAYRTREYCFDNAVTQLIRHTIEHVKSHPVGNDILNNDVETKQAIKIITDATPSYSQGQRQQVINKNIKPLSHPFYFEYKNLQKLCLQILRHEELKYGKEENEIYGVLIDAAWLWEEYLAVVLAGSFKHCTMDGKDKFHLFKDGEQQNIQRIIPDFISTDNRIIADAKYISLDKENDHENEEKATDIYYKTLAYMYYFRSSTGLLLYPYSGKSYLKTSLTLQHYQGQESRDRIIKIGIPIPHDRSDYASFANKMQDIEKTLTSSDFHPKIVSADTSYFSDRSLSVS